MIVTVKYVENSQKIGITSKNKTKKRLKLLRKKPAEQVYQSLLFAKLYTLLYLLLLSLLVIWL